MKDTLEVWWSSGYWGIHDPSVHVLHHHVPLWGLPGSLQLLKMDDAPFSDSIPVELHWFPADLALAAAQPPSLRVVYCCPQFLRLGSTSQFAEDGTSIKDILCPSVLCSARDRGSSHRPGCPSQRSCEVWTSALSPKYTQVVKLLPWQMPCLSVSGKEKGNGEHLRADRITVSLPAPTPWQSTVTSALGSPKGDIALIWERCTVCAFVAISRNVWVKKCQMQWKTSLGWFLITTRKYIYICIIAHHIKLP